MKVNGRSIQIILLLVLCFQVKGQADTTYLMKKDSLEYGFLNEKFKERKYMLYLAGRGSISNPNGVMVLDNGLYVGYERKMGKSQVFGGGAGFFLQDDGGNLSSPDKLLMLNLNHKWLYNLDYRMERGKTGNNMSANYFTLSPTVTIGHSVSYLSGYAWDFSRGEWAVKYKNKSAASLSLKIGYGLQRTIRDRIQFDIQAGFLIKRSPYATLGNFFYCQTTAGFIIK